MPDKPASESFGGKVVEKVPAWLLTSALVIVVVAFIVFSGVLLYGVVTGKISEAFGIKFRDAETSIINTELKEYFPAGAVVAFDLAPNAMEKQCPEGWTLFQPAGGRFIIGAGEHSNQDQDGKLLSVYRGNPNSSRQDLERHGNTTETIGGAEKHALIGKEMPAHDHEFTGSNVARGGYNDNIGRGTVLAVGDGKRIEDWGPAGTISEFGGGKTGEADPHNNMPPYIALYFCQYKRASRP